MKNENTITVNGTVCAIARVQGEFLLSLPGVHYMLRVKADSKLLEEANKYKGKRINVSGKLASEDTVVYNQCDCHTVSNVIESFLIAETITTAPFSNHVRIEGTICDVPKLVKTNATKFYTCRIHLSDGNGYISVSTLAEPGRKGDHIAVEGHLRWKDYERRLTCKKCGKSYTAPTLSLLVICR